MLYSTRSELKFLSRYLTNPCCISFPEAQRTQDAACIELLFLGKSGFSPLDATRGILTGGAFGFHYLCSCSSGWGWQFGWQEYLQETSHLTMSEEVVFLCLSCFSEWMQWLPMQRYWKIEKITQRAAVKGHCEIWTYRVPVTEVTPHASYSVGFFADPPSALIMFLQWSCLWVYTQGDRPVNNQLNLDRQASFQIKHIQKLHT